MLSHEYASMSAQDVSDDLTMNHGRKISKKYIQRVSESVSTIAKKKQEVWEYALPKFDTVAETIAISLDGAMLPTREEGWRESMVGTISLYNQEGERQHSIYVGESPEYGKRSFMERLDNLVAFNSYVAKSVMCC